MSYPCDRRSIVHAFVPSARKRVAWFARLDLPVRISEWTPDLIANAEVVARPQPVVGALILHTYLVHDECGHEGRQPTGPEESTTVLAVEEGGDSGEIVPVRRPYGDDVVVGFEWFVGATDADETIAEDDIAGSATFLRRRAYDGLNRYQARHGRAVTAA